MTEAEKLAALDRAATQGVWETGDRMEANYVWASKTHLACFSSTTDDGLGSDTFERGKSEAVANADLACALVNAYRANQLVLIGPDAVGDVARAICNAHCVEMYGVIDSHMIENEWADWIPEARAAIAALGVK